MQYVGNFGEKLAFGAADGRIEPALDIFFLIRFWL